MGGKTRRTSTIMAGAAFAAVPIIIVFHFPEIFHEGASRWCSQGLRQGQKKCNESQRPYEISGHSCPMHAMTTPVKYRRPSACAGVTEYLIGKKVTGVRRRFRPGECILSFRSERKALLEAVIAQAAGRMSRSSRTSPATTRATAWSCRPRRERGRDCIAAIPPIYSIIC